MMLFTLLLMCGLFLRAQTERRLYTKAEQEEEKLMAPFAAMRGMF